MIISPLVVVSPPPRPQLKFVAEMSTNGRPPVIPSCISVIWCEKKEDVLCSVSEGSVCALGQTGILKTVPH